MAPYPEDLRHGEGLYSADRNQDYVHFLPHYSHSAPFGFKVPCDCSEHLTPYNCRFDYWHMQRAFWSHKQLFVQILRPVDWTCTAFECVLNDRILEDHIPRTAIVHRNNLQDLLQGARNPRVRDGDTWTRPSHTPDFLHWMARHPTGTK